MVAATLPTYHSYYPIYHPIYCFLLLRIPGFGIRRASPPLDAIPPEAIFYLQCIHCRPIKASKVCVSRRNHLKYLCKSTLVSKLHVNKHKTVNSTHFCHTLLLCPPRGGQESQWLIPYLQHTPAVRRLTKHINLTLMQLSTLHTGPLLELPHCTPVFHLSTPNDSMPQMQDAQTQQ